MIRVVIAEDCLTVRELLVEILERDPEICVVGQAKNGAEAVTLAARLRPDLVTMDVHMPLMDGFEATKRIMLEAPVPIVIVSSSLSREDVNHSFDALRAGALTVLAKPDHPESALFEGRRDEFVAMVKAMSQVKVVRRWGHRVPAAAPPHAAHPASAKSRLVAIAASTGGPAALQRIVAGLPRDFPVPILVVQHIAAGFIGGLADWLGASCNLCVKVAEPREPLLPHHVYLAPDDRHLGVSRDRVVIADAPPINGFRPSGSYLFAAASQAYAAGLTAVILTGMGNDGVEGLKTVRAANGKIIAQDEATSVVYGMPREAVTAGLADFVLPLDDIAGHLVKLVQGGTHARADSDR